MTKFVALAADFRGRMISPGCVRQIEVCDSDVCRLVSPRPSIVKEQQEGMVAAPLGCVEIGGTQQCIDLVFLKIGDLGLGAFLERDIPDLTAPLDVLRLVVRLANGINRTSVSR